MSRNPRFYLVDYPHCIAHKAVNNGYAFKGLADYKSFLYFMRESAGATHCRINGYSLLLNQVNILLTPETKGSISDFMRMLNCSYAHWFNEKYKRKGTLWRERFQCAVVEPESEFLEVLTYIESIPLGLGLVVQPESYPWSSYAHHVMLDHSSIIDESNGYLTLGNTRQQRAKVYRRYFYSSNSRRSRVIREEIANRIKAGQPLGSQCFRDAMAALAGRSQVKRGRPRKIIITQDDSY